MNSAENFAPNKKLDLDQILFLDYDRYVSFFVEKTLSDVVMFQRKVDGVESYLRNSLPFVFSQSGIPTDPLEFWRAASKDFVFPKGLLPVIQSLLCLMPTSTAVERSFKLLQRILTSDRCAMSRRTEMVLHFILANMDELEYYDDFELFSSGIRTGIVGTRDYENTLFSQDDDSSNFSIETTFSALSLN